MDQMKLTTELNLVGSDMAGVGAKVRAINLAMDAADRNYEEQPDNADKDYF
jgi:hypothetical protein